MKERATARMPAAFAGSDLDRADHVRADADALSGLMDWRARLLRMDGLAPVAGADNCLEWGTLADCEPEDELVFLGLLGGKGCFAAVPQPGKSGSAPAMPTIWHMLATMPAADLATYGAARSLVDWHMRHRFCANCGHGTRIAKGGWQRSCDACGADHFPRTDPVTIMLVEHTDGRLLLGRQPRFPARRFSALAGFVEPGEDIEEAVKREVKEEAGITVRDVSYVASQPWPFPSQLMIGCHAMTDEDALTVDETELEEARWFTREEVAEAMQAGENGAAFIAPPRLAIANTLLTWWLER